jgi:dipeptidyl aminopeptidase/acylaminoacyl peptidase
MLSNGKLMLLGKSRPQIDPSTLGETRLIEYTARDGMIIPAFLTTPPKSVYGAGPFPAIVLPHGGPWARDNLDWDFSGWTQYFASRGYVVIQPQFRGSEGWGQKLWRAGDGEWGQKMQDDDDDAAKWLIANKFAAPDRIALHGYSYGGYTAFAGAVRPNGLYQCTIAGAGVAELANFKRLTFENRFQREFQNPTIAGLDPLSHAAQVSVPMLIYHGDRDQTVPIKESRNFSAALKAAGKPYKYIELPDMGHQFIFWSPDNQRQVLDAIDAYLKTDCGPGGL